MTDASEKTGMETADEASDKDGGLLVFRLNDEYYAGTWREIVKQFMTKRNWRIAYTPGTDGAGYMAELRNGTGRTIAKTRSETDFQDEKATDFLYRHLTQIWEKDDQYVFCKAEDAFGHRWKESDLAKSIEADATEKTETVKKLSDRDRIYVDINSDWYLRFCRGGEDYIGTQRKIVEDFMWDHDWRTEYTPRVGGVGYLAKLLDGSGRTIAATYSETDFQDEEATEFLYLQLRLLWKKDRHCILRKAVDSLGYMRAYPEILKNISAYDVWLHELNLRDEEGTREWYSRNRTAQDDAQAYKLSRTALENARKDGFSAGYPQVLYSWYKFTAYDIWKQHLDVQNERKIRDCLRLREEAEELKAAREMKAREREKLEAENRERDRMKAEAGEVSDAEADEETDGGESRRTFYTKYGCLREEYLKENRHGYYTYLKMSGKLVEHLVEIDQAANRRLNIIMEEMNRKDPPPESFMERLGHLNMTRLMAEEIVLSEIVYNGPDSR